MKIQLRKVCLVLSVVTGVSGCNSTNKEPVLSLLPQAENVFRISFGSCNNHLEPNALWEDIYNANPQVFVWGGDIIYADTDQVDKIESYYSELAQLPAYAKLASKVPISGTWDDHDYGLNDGGADFEIKDESKEALIRFLKIPEDHPVRSHPGVYRKQELTYGSHTVAILHLDTRYFRSALTEGEGNMRYQPGTYGEGTMLGEAQWSWLINEIQNSKDDLIVINSSIQVLSAEHGFEKWNNLPHERDRLLDLINSSPVPVVILSGDRHISEFSLLNPDARREFPLLDFTSSGLTHSYTGFSVEPNAYRVKEVVSTTSFGILDIDFEAKVVQAYIVGDQREVLESLEVEF